LSVATYSCTATHHAATDFTTLTLNTGHTGETDKINLCTCPNISCCCGCNF